MTVPLIHEAKEVKLIPIDKIRIVNPRVRNKKVFNDIAMNISRVGLKRPITVTTTKSRSTNKEYDLVCGQGRIEAFKACGQTEIPAIVIEADEEQALIMSLVENLARKTRRPNELLRSLDGLRKNGYSSEEIAEKTGLSSEYISDIINLIDRGEDRLLAAIERNQISIGVALRIAESPGNEQAALQDAYESKELKGKRFFLAKKLINERKRRGKKIRGSTTSADQKAAPDKLSVQDIMSVYQREVDRKKLISKKAEAVNNRLVFITEAFRRLLQDENFRTLLRAENELTIPQPLVELIEQKGVLYAERP